MLYFSVNTCTVPTVINATPVPASTIDYNYTVTYTCQDGHSHTAGDLIRICKADGSLTGTTPVCTSKLQWLCWLKCNMNINVYKDLKAKYVIEHFGHFGK